MRITKISLKNFRAFYAEHEIDLGRKGNNLLVYGENGSGKSSLLKAIELFLDSHIRDIDFATHQNFFVSEPDVGHVKISIRSSPKDPETTYEWSQITRETHHPIILEASKTKGCLDYKALLQVYFLNPQNCEVNLFNLLIDTILNNTINPRTSKLFSEEWLALKQRPIPKSKGHINIIQAFEDAIREFNLGLGSILNELKIETETILKYFNYPIDIDFKFDGILLDLDRKCLEGNEVILRVEFQATHFQLAHEFLNEAKLSAISLSIYLAALRINPSSDLRVLALDDVLIGLDMSNRIPVIDILKEKFSDYQIFLMTYDKEWYEILNRNFQSWKKLELYAGRGIDYEIPMFVENSNYLDKAKVHLNSNDHKAAAIYLRTAFEVKIKTFCEKMNILIKYREKPKDLSTNDFWEPIKNSKESDGKPKYIDHGLAFDVELYRSFIMNPLSHTQLAIAPRRDIENAIATIEKLEQVLDEIIDKKKSSTRSHFPQLS